MIFMFFEKGEMSRNALFIRMKRGSGHAKRHQKSIKNRCKIDAGKRHAKSMENDAKMEPKWMPKSIKKTKNAGKKACRKSCRNLMPILIDFGRQFDLPDGRRGVRGQRDSALSSLTRHDTGRCRRIFGPLENRKSVPNGTFDHAACPLYKKSDPKMFFRK